jgi:hypothetical protein
VNVHVQHGNSGPIVRSHAIAIACTWLDRARIVRRLRVAMREPVPIERTRSALFCTAIHTPSRTRIELSGSGDREERFVEAGKSYRALLTRRARPACKQCAMLAERGAIEHDRHHQRSKND